MHPLIFLRFEPGCFFRCRGSAHDLPAQGDSRRRTRPRLSLEYQPNRLAGVAAENRKSMLALVAEDQVAFAEGTAEQPLDRIDPAGVVFDHGHQFLVPVAAQIQRLFRQSGRPIADDETGANVSVEPDRLRQLGGNFKLFHFIFLPR